MNGNHKSLFAAVLLSATIAVTGCKSKPATTPVQNTP